MTRRAGSGVPSERTAVRFQAVGKTYPTGTVALDGLSFAMREGEIVSLIGPSGCGKSTALRLLAGLSAPTAGTVAHTASAGLAEIGFVFQDPTLMPWASVERNVALPLQLARRPRAEIRERVAAALALVGLADFAGAWPRALSGGMKMRVSIARALVTAPRLLLMDEPFAALDEITRFRLNDELLALAARMRLTILFVTHSVYEAVYLSHRVAVMTPRPGRIFSELPIAAPDGRTADFRGSPLFARQARDVSAALAAAMEGSR